MVSQQVAVEELVERVREHVSVPTDVATSACPVIEHRSGAIQLAGGRRYILLVYPERVLLIAASRWTFLPRAIRLREEVPRTRVSVSDWTILRKPALTRPPLCQFSLYLNCPTPLRLLVAPVFHKLGMDLYHDLLG